jgi:hypothetical protein
VHQSLAFLGFQGAYLNALVDEIEDIKSVFEIPFGTFIS